VGVPPPLVTVAVNVTDCPKTDGLGDELTAVVVAGLFTTCDFVPALPVKFESPE